LQTCSKQRVLLPGLAFIYRAKVARAKFLAHQNFIFTHSTLARHQHLPMRDQTKEGAHHDPAEKSDRFIHNVVVLVVVQEPDGEGEQTQRCSYEQGHGVS
jgi:hypothetical protein